ncbi:hypothetical protein [Mongoliitalea lutea]|nr:hypothetical protein [Mongoliitalea lutea]
MIEELPDNTWPVPKLVFLVDWGSLRNIPFQEVDGLGNGATSIRI